MAGMPFDLQLLNVCAAMLLLLSFAMLAQRRIVSLVNLLPLELRHERRRHGHL